MNTVYIANAEMGSTGMYILSGIFVIISMFFAVTGLHRRFRDRARWKGGTERSVIGTVLFCIGIFVMAGGMAVRGFIAQAGSFAGVPLGLLVFGLAILIAGPLYDIIKVRN